ncbi:MAG: acetylornithine/succinylornithine family transaminase [Fibrobacterales bacterium]
MSLKEMNDTYLLGNYARYDFEFTHGEGPYLFDRAGKKYLDFVGGIAVTSLGHNFAPFKEAIAKQVENYLHISNLYVNEKQVALAQLLVNASDFDKVFFCNSGTEANEAAIKFVRKHFDVIGQPNRKKIISFNNSFHGRTYGGMAATGQAKIQEGFGSMLDGFKALEWNNCAMLAEAIDDSVAAIILEPIQGEGGIWVPTPEFIQEICRIQAECGVMIIADEIQTGLGRMGAFLGSDRVGLFPDVVTLAKPLAAGLPLGAVLLKDELATQIKPGDHGSTFGGNPVACAVGEVFVKEITKLGFMESVQERSTRFKNGLKTLGAMYDFLGDVRGDGFILGIETSLPIAEIIKKCADRGLLILRAGTNVLRFLPPLNCTDEEIQVALHTLNDIFQEQQKEVNNG